MTKEAAKADDHGGDGGGKNAMMGAVAAIAAICFVIGIAVPFAMGGIGDGVLQLTSKLALGAASVESQRNALVAIGVGCGLLIAGFFGGVALGINFLVAAMTPTPAPAHAPAAHAPAHP